MNITEIIPADLSGYCDISTGECVLPETHAATGVPAQNPEKPQDEKRSSQNAVLTKESSVQPAESR